MQLATFFNPVFAPQRWQIWLVMVSWFITVGVINVYASK
jgi:hypothetical protein